MSILCFTVEICQNGVLAEEIQIPTGDLPGSDGLLVAVGGFFIFLVLRRRRDDEREML